MRSAWARASVSWRTAALLALASLACIALLQAPSPKERQNAYEPLQPARVHRLGQQLMADQASADMFKPSSSTYNIIRKAVTGASVSNRLCGYTTSGGCDSTNYVLMLATQLVPGLVIAAVCILVGIIWWSFRCCCCGTCQAGRGTCCNTEADKRDFFYTSKEILITKIVLSAFWLLVFIGIILGFYGNQDVTNGFNDTTNGFFNSANGTVTSLYAVADKANSLAGSTVVSTSTTSQFASISSSAQSTISTMNTYNNYRSTGFIVLYSIILVGWCSMMIVWFYHTSIPFWINGFLGYLFLFFLWVGFAGLLAFGVVIGDTCVEFDYYRTNSTSLGAITYAYSCDTSSNGVSSMNSTVYSNLYSSGATACNYIGNTLTGYTKSGVTGQTGQHCCQCMTCTSSQITGDDIYFLVFNSNNSAYLSSGGNSVATNAATDANSATAVGKIGTTVNWYQLQQQMISYSNCTYVLSIVNTIYSPACYTLLSGIFFSVFSCAWLGTFLIFAQVYVIYGIKRFDPANDEAHCKLSGHKLEDDEAVDMAEVHLGKA
eukprot:gnl/Hemi2/18733_TR6201_c0_g1_i2.p1 gnl/Hemi2/18733_TR6201_c0_g1~~gnl/Hemi2/18733_TR6201_c0_g1_i2.p1  ORF type:complete len:546 (-),score=169.84 gnl/Hemi2/18733_TR6201_c0_g1_i2:237-1874(-)